MVLSLKNLSIDLGTFRLEVNLEAHGPVTAIFGPSGAGKTSLLDVIAGLRRPLSGAIQRDQDLLTDTALSVYVPARKRAIGYVPQDLSLFPHLSVRENLLFGHRRQDAALFTFEHVVKVLELQALLTRSPVQLSGGEQQRVALARALLTSPRLLILDEPLRNLDLPLKLRILPYLARIRDEFRIPMLFVTHDRFETLSLANEMAVMVQGRIVQQGAVRDVFSRPASLEVAALLTIETIQPGRIMATQAELATVAVSGRQLSALEPDLPAGTMEVHVCIRAEDVILLRGPDAPSSARNHLPGVVQSIAPAGPFMRVDLDCGFPLASLITRQALEELSLQPGCQVLALVKAPHVHLIPR